MKKTGFTLAEVLITLGVIGVVSAITIPTLIQKHNVNVVVNQLTKTLSEINQAYQMHLALTGEAPLTKDLIQYLKPIKICELKSDGCADEIYYYRISKKNDSYFGKTDTKAGTDADNAIYVNLSDGKIIRFEETNQTECPKKIFGSGSLSEFCSNILVDINGNKGPNERGKDLFVFQLTSKNIVPSGSKDATKYKFSTRCKYKTSVMDSCTAWVIYNRNMDYLHCDDLSWDGKTTCK